MSTPAFTHDVFLSHRSKDKTIVRASSLSAANGERAKIEEGLEHLEFELQPLLNAPLNKERRFVPLRLDDAIKSSVAQRPRLQSSR